MHFGSLFSTAASLKERLRKKPCKRCGLYFDPEREAHCPHCHHLDNFALAQLRERLQDRKAGNKKLGVWFLFAGICVAVLFIVASFG